VFQKGIVLYCARRECVDVELVSALLSANCSFVGLLQVRGDKNYAYDILEGAYSKKPQQYTYMQL